MNEKACQCFIRYLVRVWVEMTVIVEYGLNSMKISVILRLSSIRISNEPTIGTITGSLLDYEQGLRLL